MLDAGYPIEDLITTSRLVGRAMSRISDAHTRSFRDRLVGPLLAAGPDEAGRRRLSCGTLLILWRR